MTLAKSPILIVIKKATMLITISNKKTSDGLDNFHDDNW